MENVLFNMDQMHLLFYHMLLFKSNESNGIIARFEEYLHALVKIVSSELLSFNDFFNSSNELFQ